MLCAGVVQMLGRTSGPLTEEGLENIRQHKYKGGQYTKLDNLLNPLWTKSTELLPMWVPPNVVTAVGGVCHLTSLGLTMVYCPTFTEVAPAWVLQVCAVLIFSGYWLDCMDGKQARRTGSSSPLGQLFDHGCDALSLLAHFSLTAILTAPLASSFRLVVANLVILHTTFFLSQWVEYHTHELIHSLGGFGITEVISFAVVMALGLSFVDRGQGSILDMEVSLPMVGAANLSTLYMVGFVIMHMILIPCSLWLVVSQKRGAELVWALSHVAPVVAIGVVTLFGWPEEVLATHSRILCLPIWMLYSLMSIQVIVFGMARQALPAIPWPAVLYCVTAMATRWYPQHAREVLLALFAIYLILVVEWSVSAIRQVTAKLGIRIFHLHEHNKED